MDIGSWLSLIISVALAVPLSIIGTMLTPRVIAYLEQRKLIKTHRTKEQELRAYKQVEDFKKGRRNPYPVYIMLGTLSVICAIGFATSVLIFMWVANYVSTTQPLFALFLMTFLFFILMILFVVLIGSTARRIEKFDEYTAEMRKKWGDDVV